MVACWQLSHELLGPGYRAENTVVVHPRKYLKLDEISEFGWNLWATVEISKIGWNLLTAVRSPKSGDIYELLWDLRILWEWHIRYSEGWSMSDSCDADATVVLFGLSNERIRLSLVRWISFVSLSEEQWTVSTSTWFCHRGCLERQVNELQPSSTERLGTSRAASSAHEYSRWVNVYPVLWQLEHWLMPWCKLVRKRTTYLDLTVFTARAMMHWCSDGAKREKSLQINIGSSNVASRANSGFSHLLLVLLRSSYFCWTR